MHPSEHFEDLFLECRELSDDGAWSRAVGLARQSEIAWLYDDEAGSHFSIRAHTGIASRKLRLDPAAQIWQCTCNSEEDPCTHVVATLIALRNKQIITQNSTWQIGYRFYLDDGGALRLTRFLSKDFTTTQPKNGLETFDSLKDLIVRRKDISIDAEDSRLDEIIEFAKPFDDGSSQTSSHNSLRLSFPLLQASKRVFFDDQPVSLKSIEGTSHIEVSRESNHYRIRAIPMALPTTQTNSEQDCALKELFPGLWLTNTELIFLSETDLPKMFRPPGTLIAQSKAEILFDQAIPQLAEKYEIQFRNVEPPTFVDEVPRLELKAEPLGLDSVIIESSIVYGSPPLARLQAGKFESQHRSLLPRRKPELERKILDMLPRNLRESPRLELSGARAVSMLSEFLEHLADVRPVQHLLTTTSLVPHLGESSTSLLSLRLQDPEPDATEISVSAAVGAFRRGEGVIKMPSGAWARIPVDWFKDIEKNDPTMLELLEQERVHTSSVPRVVQSLQRYQVEIPAKWREFVGFLENPESLPEAQLPPNFQGTLRSYQRSGVSWLKCMQECHVGALLADDMGLGKTVQSICALESPSLIICPTSVLSGWCKQLRQFRPDLSINAYHGEARVLDLDSDVTVTTYGVLRRDIELLRSHPWNTLVLDEAHIIKNPYSRVSTAARQLPAVWRLALTGTPIENHIVDLWSQFEFLNPGFFPNYEQFQNWSHQRIANLAQPFIMRRTKDTVAADLPPKTEIILHCDLKDHERQLYSTVLQRARQTLSSETAASSTMQILEVLLRLRQICCHSGLVSQELRWKDSAKIELLMQSLEASIENKHPALVFSQWTSLLDIVEEHLIQRGIKFLRLDGSTKDRQAVIDQFQDESGPPVMLISLKAGGVGLTLTRAEHVYLTDPWWNPAVEEQAVDRAHRIGQTRPVFVYKLIAQNTVEEHVLNLQREKQAMIQDVLGSQAEATVSADVMRSLLEL